MADADQFLVGVLAGMWEVAGPLSSPCILRKFWSVISVWWNGLTLPLFLFDVCNQAVRKGLSLQFSLIMCAMTSLFVFRLAGPKSLYAFNLCM